MVGGALPRSAGWARAVLVALPALPRIISGSEGQLRTAGVSRRLRAAAARLTRIEPAVPCSFTARFHFGGSALMAVTFPARQTTGAVNEVSAEFTGPGEQRSIAGFARLRACAAIGVVVARNAWGQERYKTIFMNPGSAARSAPARQHRHSEPADPWPGASTYQEAHRCAMTRWSAVR
jgi:hypothetical protein